MAIINCPECGKEISDKTSKCIHCGYPIIENLTNEKEKNITAKENVKQQPPKKKSIFEKLKDKLSEKAKILLKNILVKLKDLVKKIISSKKGIITLLTLLALIVAFVVVYVLNFTPEAYYNKGLKAFDNKDYVKAMSYYQAAGDYKDAIYKYSLSKDMDYFEKGKNLYEEKKWTEAISTLEECKSIEEKESIINKCHYGYAVELLGKKEYGKSKEEFEKTNGYSDSLMKINECNYYIAEKLFEDNKYTEAANKYKESNNFADSEEKIITIGNKLIDYKNYSDAVEVFNCLSENKLSDSKAYRYASGKVFYEEKQYDKAAKEFSEARDYKDGAKLYEETVLERGYELIKRKGYIEAKTWFENHSDISELKKHIDICNLMLAKEKMNTGMLTDAKNYLKDVAPETEYSNISYNLINGLLTKNKKYVDMCGYWDSTKGVMKTTEKAGYLGSTGWKRDIGKEEYSMMVKCLIADDGKIEVEIDGIYPYYKNYSYYSNWVESGRNSIDFKDEVKNTGSIKVDSKTTISFSGNTATLNYKDVQYPMSYTTDTMTTSITYKKNTSY